MGGDDRAEMSRMGAEVSLSRRKSAPGPAGGRSRRGGLVGAALVAALLLPARSCQLPAAEPEECLPDEPAPAPSAPGAAGGPWWLPWWDAPRLCPGRVLVLDEVGEPVEGASLYLGSNRLLRTDAEGAVYWDERPCGPFAPELRVGDVRYPVEAVEVLDDEDVVLVLGEERHAVLELVDADCAPWDRAPTRPASVAAVERVGPGRFEIWAAEEEVSLSLWVDGVTQAVELPLDGGVHRRTVHPPRTVEIEVRCAPPGPPAEDPGAPREPGAGRCPTTWWCAWEPCEAAGADLYRCRCAEGPVRESWAGREWVLPAGARRVRVSLPDEGPGRLDVLDAAPAPADCPAGAPLAAPDAVSLDTGDVGGGG